MEFTESIGNTKTREERDLVYVHHVLCEIKRHNSLKEIIDLFRNFGINKIEADYQFPDSLALFFKRYNRNGLMRGYSVYGDVAVLRGETFEEQFGYHLPNVPKIPKSFVDEEIQEYLFDRMLCDEELRKRIGRMLLVNRAEARILGLLPKDLLKFGPIFIKDIDSEGIPNSYSVCSDSHPYSSSIRYHAHRILGHPEYLKDGIPSIP